MLKRRSTAFTLLESLIVLALISILLLAVTVNFSGESAQGPDRQAQATASDALTTEYNWTSSNGTILFTPSTAALALITPDIDFVAGTAPSTNSTTASVAVATGTTNCPQDCVAVAVDAATTSTAPPTTCWYLVRNAAAPLSEDTTIYAYNIATTTTNCTGAEGLALVTLAPSSSTGASQAHPYNAAFG
jgi:prepilin-type N-terminal cleavage/methylation domain-containing protein